MASKKLKNLGGRMAFLTVLNSFGSKHWVLALARQLTIN